MLKHITLTIFTILLGAFQLFGQATNPTTSGVSSDFLGWNGSVNAPLNFNVYNQNDFVFRPDDQTFPVTLSPLTFVLGIGNGAPSQERLFVRLNQMQGNTRIGMFADNVDPQQTFGSVHAGAFVIRADGIQQRAVESHVATGATTTNTKIGIRAQLCKTKGYAIFAEAFSDDPNSANWAAWFDGDVYHSGTWLPPSDINFKTDITPLEGALDLIAAFEPKQYNFRVEEFETLRLPNGQHYGFIAQEVEEFLPELVSIGSSITKYDEEGEIEHEPVEFRSLNYFAVIPIVIGALGERQAMIDDQVATIAALEEAIAQLEAQFEE